jgi:regulator of cell morphogenesis and NO signaling
MNITPETTIGEVVKNNFRTAGVFEKYNLDFCCGGKKLLSVVCKEKGVDESELKNELTSIKNEYDSNKINLWSLSFLCDYITENHHKYLKNLFPQINTHINKVVNAHGDRLPYLNTIRELFIEIQCDLISHMEKEEKILFPYIKHIEESSSHAVPPFGNVETPISVMVREHEEAGEGIEKLKELTDNFTPPENACTTFKTTYAEFGEFYKDLKVHIHLENNILFPAAINAEEGKRNILN